MYAIRSYYARKAMAMFEKTHTPILGSIHYTKLYDGFNIHTIYEASSGQEALEILRNESIDVAILDFQMEGMDGLELIKFMRDEDRMDNRNNFV